MPRTHDPSAPRGLGTIVSVGKRENGYIFAADHARQEYFIHRSACRPIELFHDLQIGDPVSFSIADAPKGLRGHDVKRMTASEHVEWLAREAAYLDDLGNRGNRVEMAVTEAIEEIATPARRGPLKRRQVR